MLTCVTRSTDAAERRPRPFVSGGRAPRGRAAGERSSDTWDGVVPDRLVAHMGSREDADPAGADEETDDDEDDAEQDLPAKRGDDAGDDQDHGENPQQSGHETFEVQPSSRRATVLNRPRASWDW